MKTKQFNSIYVLLFAASLCILIFRCNSSSESGKEMNQKMEQPDQSGPEYTSKYICPMHCEGSGSDQPGICPVCEMDYELNETYIPPVQDSTAL